ncbi:hypothetical protein [Fulvivirga lutea]|uniref:DUF4905 domain-containing protein n=1 Tax=Fulvivirga lutea TaxID=2810512 RepID=A0A975A2Z7_9BACT|nr:hypothetical protein [Fulvivirga lutea]QSE99072.1 hypothetical protein JR347_08290 [Fulvivirga lutea]
MAGKLNLIFSYKFELSIWKYVISQSGTFLVFELRSDKSDEVRFTYYDLVEKRLVEINLNESDFRTTLFEIEEDQIYFKKYDAGANPVIQSILSWDRNLASTKVLPSDTNVNRTENRLISPSLYTAINEHYPLLVSFIKSLTNDEPNNKGIEYLEWNDYVVVSYYTGEKSMANFLLVVNNNKEIVVHEQLGINLLGIGQDTFTVDGNKLIFVKDNCEIFIYQYE